MKSQTHKEDGLVSLVDAASILGLKRDTLKNYCNIGRLKTAIKTDKYNVWPDTVAKWYIKEEEVASLLNEKESSELRFVEYKSESAIDSVLRIARENAESVKDEIRNIKRQVMSSIEREMSLIPDFEESWLKSVYSYFASRNSILGGTFPVKNTEGSYVTLKNPFPEIDFKNPKKIDVRKIAKVLGAEKSIMDECYSVIISAFASLRRSKERQDVIMDMIHGALLEGDKNQAESDALLLAIK